MQLTTSQYYNITNSRSPKSIKKGEKAAVLFINVKSAFDHGSKKKLAERMTDLELDGDLVGWTQSFLINKKIELIIDGYINLEVIVNISIS